MAARPDEYEAYLKHLFGVAIGAVQAEKILPPNLPTPPKGKLAILAVGKGAAAMAHVAADHYNTPFEGLLITHTEPPGIPEGFRTIVASHPVPDERSVEAARAALELASRLGPDDMLLVLLSGGGSALMAAPKSGISLQDKSALTKALLASGASIQEINTVRKKLSAIKGGKLAEAAYPAEVITLAVSDVVGDTPGIIASGPTVTSTEKPADTHRVLQKYSINIPDTIAEALHAESGETQKQGKNKFQVIGSGKTAISAVTEAAWQKGFDVINLGEVEGEARDAAVRHAELAYAVKLTRKPTLILSSGELTVTLECHTGKGGPNTEYALALALALKGTEGIYAIACDTDGKDGTGDNAGAAVGPTTLKSGLLNATEHLQAHDSYGFFEKNNGLVRTGPTGTNVNDFRAILITGE